MLINNNTTVRIILADDDIDDCTMFKEALEHINMKYSFKVFHSGNELLSHLDTVQNLPHIIFLDLNMPGFSGIETLKEIRNQDKYNPLAIAIYSTSSRELDMEETLANGANCYIIKPNTFKSLKTVLRHVLSQYWQYRTSKMVLENFIVSL